MVVNIKKVLFKKKYHNYGANLSEIPFPKFVTGQKMCKKVDSDSYSASPQGNSLDFCMLIWGLKLEVVRNLYCAETYSD